MAARLEARVWRLAQQGKGDAALEDAFLAEAQSDAERALAPLCARAASAAARGRGSAAERAFREAMNQLWAEVHFFMQACPVGM